MEQNAFVEKKTTERSSAKKTVTIAENDDVISKVGESFPLILCMKDILSLSVQHTPSIASSISQENLHESRPAPIPTVARYKKILSLIEEILVCLF